MQDLLFSFVAKYKINDTGNENLFVAQGDTVVVEKMDQNEVIFDFKYKHHNRTGKSMTMKKKDFDSHFKRAYNAA